MPAIDITNFDETVRPADDFFHYVNGGWLAKNPIPPDESRWGSFYTLRKQVDDQLHEILEEISKKENVTPGSDERKVRDFYRSATNIEWRNQLGVTPLEEIFKKIDDAASVKDIMRIAGFLHRAGVGVFWSPFVEQDEKNSEVMALHWYQGGLGLPDRDYYLKDDEKNKKIREDYVSYMNDMLRQAMVVADAASLTKVIMDIETRLAKASLTRVELRDVEKMYNKISLAEFSALAPRMSTNDYFETIEMRPPGYIIVGQPKFFEELSRIFAEASLDDLKIYLRWHVLNDLSNYLTENLERRNFDFYGRTFSGATEMKPLWRRALIVMNGSLDELLGKIYVAKYFSEDAKKKIKDLVEHLVTAYRERIKKLDWMGEETKKKAIEKLGTVSKKLGYPDVWKDYSSLTIEADSYVENVMRAHALEFDRKMKEVGGPVNREEWLMPPQMVNAYYMPPMNDIAFPAAILQPPFFDPNADDAVNFGGIGSVIGHELTHGFDDQGSRFDARGNLNEWWTAEDKMRFDAKAAQLAEQFDKYEPLPGLHIQGKLTLGENIADLGGLLIAWDGLKAKLAESGKTSGAAPELIDGFTPEQRFFISAAICEGVNIREEALRLQVQTDPHSPSQFRANGPVSNMTEFYGAFNVKLGDKLYREENDRAVIW